MAAEPDDSDLAPIRGTRQERGRTRRVAILQAARKLFAQNGFRGTSLVALAQEVGITDAGLLYHFPNKKKLLLAVIAETDQEQEDRMTGGRHIADADYISAWAEFGRVLEDDAVLTALDVLLSAEHLQTKSDFNDYYRQRYASFRDQLVRAFEAGRQAGRFRNDFDPQTEAVLMIAALDGLRLQWLLSNGEISMGDAMRYFIRHMEERIKRN